MGMQVIRHYTTPETNVWDTVEWHEVDAVIKDSTGAIVFEQRGIRAPKSWSQLAVNIVASKYFRGHIGQPNRETSVTQLVDRVSRTLTTWGSEGGYFDCEASKEAFYAELTYLLLHQQMAFNSPVWFNVGAMENPQCSACFINSVEDSMASIMRLAATEARLFKGGSGTGTNLSALRSSKEPLTGGGYSSGPVAFMRGYDAFAGVIKSGGRNRRAAKMVMLDDSHPDILEFVRCKAHEERKAQALIDAGYDGAIDGDAYGTVAFQNANHSIRASDAFMTAAEMDLPWPLLAVRTGLQIDTIQARALLDEVAKATHACGDPGMQFEDTINWWHTCKATGRIDASNPCSEYMFLPDTACNLASLNLLKYESDMGFEVEAFKHDVALTILAQEIMVDRSSYPTERITENSHAFRPLGLGYANLGALLLRRGLPYDSAEGRDLAAGITALMGGWAYATSAQISRTCGGPFSGYALNQHGMGKVIRDHRQASRQLVGGSSVLARAAQEAWDVACEVGDQWGFRNAQATVLAPTGTIAFMMDCDTTGIEPDIALVKYKRLVGGGQLKIASNSVLSALRSLHYTSEQIDAICAYVAEKDTIEGAPYIQDVDLPVFDCAFKPANGTRSIVPAGHIRMMAAVQPFLSGAISKTVNVPTDATVNQIRDLYVMSWQLGLKAVAIYRDGCKRTQPLNTATEAVKKTEVLAPQERRRKLGPDRTACVHKFQIAGHKGYVTLGFFPDGQPGEVFITMSKEGSTIRGLMDTIAVSMSLLLQWGMPWQKLVERFSHTRFEPAGFTGNPEIPIAKSIVDYVVRWIGLRMGGPTAAILPANPAKPDGGTCMECGAPTQQSGTCSTCTQCGATSGCG